MIIVIIIEIEIMIVITLDIMICMCIYTYYTYTYIICTNPRSQHHLLDKFIFQQLVQLPEVFQSFGATANPPGSGTIWQPK